MSAWSLSEAVKQLRWRDSTLKLINLIGKDLTDSQLGELPDSLVGRPDVVTHVWLANNQLTDETGVKLARYLAASSTIQWLDLSHNQFGSATYLAVAAALRVNSSLRVLYLSSQEFDQSRIDAAFVEALWLNPDRPKGSKWYLYSLANEFNRLKHAADQLGHPSLQQLLVRLR